MPKIIKPIFILLLAFSINANAEKRLAILPFELNDITSLPNIQSEKSRTAAFKPLLEQAMEKIGGYKIIPVSIDDYKAENAGLGYLFRFDDIAARLGKKAGADWIIVSQHSKPSFLYSYLIAHLIEVKTGRLVARYDIELKGNDHKVSVRGIRKLSGEINRTLKLRD